MKEAFGNMLHMDADALVITTNGFVKSNGQAVMGRGIAQQVAKHLPGFPKALGNLLRFRGNSVHFVMRHSDMALVTMPVKPASVIFDGTNVVAHATHHFNIGDTAPGFWAKAQLDIIERSAHQLVDLANANHWNTVILPRPGCGAGELNWTDVKPILDAILDDRFIACTYAPE